MKAISSTKDKTEQKMPFDEIMRRALTIKIKKKQDKKKETKGAKAK